MIVRLAERPLRTRFGTFREVLYYDGQSNRKGVRSLSQRPYWPLAVFSGGLLASMIFLNGMLARYTSPAWSSLFVHGLGTIVAGIFVAPVFPGRARRREKAPLWSYLGGGAGALTVVLSNITVNSPIGLSGTLALMLLGQTVFGLLVDALGLFQMRRRTLTAYDFVKVLFVMSGSAILIFFAR